jgi:hypothetical protein
MTQPLLVVLPTHLGDADNAERLLRWIAELGNVSEHSLLIAADSEIPQERVKAMLDLVRSDFYSVRAMIVRTGVKGWPLAANLSFRAVARQVSEFYRLPYCWLEPDAVPLRATWLDDLADAYAHSPRPFMGAIIDNENPTEGLPPRYVSAIGVWPQDTYARLEDLWKDARFNGPVKPSKLGVAQWQNSVRAFDMIAADFLVPRTHHTSLVQSFWGTNYTTAPVFVTERTEADPPNAVTLGFVRKDAAVFHRVKGLERFLPMWRVRLEYEMAKVTEALKPTGASQYVLEKALEAGLIEAPAVLPAPALIEKSPATVTVPSMPGASNPNFKGGSSPEADKARRQARAQESREYLTEAKRKHQEQLAAQQAAAAKQAEPATV